MVGVPLHIKAAVVGCTFLAGSIFGGVGVHKIWNGHIKDKRIKRLIQTVDEQKASGDLTAKAIKISDGIDARKDKEISRLTTENTRLAGVNAELAESRVASDTRVITQGTGLKNEASKNDKCATTNMDDGMRLFANGRGIIFPAKVPVGTTRHGF